MSRIGIRRLAGLAWLGACAVALAPPARSGTEATGIAGPASPLTIAEVLAIPRVGDIAALPGGGVAWVETVRGASNLFVAYPPAYVPTRLTEHAPDDGVPTEIAAVSRDGARLLYFRGGLPNRAGETPNPQNLPDPTERTLNALVMATRLTVRIDGGPGSTIRSADFSADGSHVIYARGGEVWSRRLTADGANERLFTVRGTVRSLSLSPDGERLAFVSDRSRYRRGSYAFVGVFGFADRAVRYMAPGAGIDLNPVWSADGARIAFIRYPEEPKTWRFSDLSTGAPFSVVVADARTGDGGPVWTADIGRGSRFSGFAPDGYDEPGGIGALFWLADGRLAFPWEKSGWRLLYAVAPGGGAAQVLTPGRFEVDGARLSPDRSTLVYWSNSESDPHRLHLYALAPATDRKPRELTRGDGIEFDAAFGEDGRSMFYRQASPAVPQRLVVSPDLRDEIQLSSGPKPGDPLTRKTVAGEIVTITADDGFEVPAVLFRPPGAHAAHSLPAIVHAHGGSRSKFYPVWDRFPVLRYFMSRGYVVLSVNYRSGVGYGLDFREPADYGGRGAGDVRDFIAAARFLAKAVPEVDPKRLAIYGHSYGGHIVSNVLARTDLFALGVDSAGVGDWVVEMEADSGASLPFNIEQRARLESQAYDSSAISVIDGWGDEPILFLHGDDDQSAALQQTLELYLALQRRGKRAEVQVLPGESHGVSLYRNQVRQLEAIEAFFTRHLR